MFAEDLQQIVNKMFFDLSGTGSMGEIFDNVSGVLLALPGIHSVVLRNVADGIQECKVLRVAGMLSADDLNDASDRMVCRWVFQEGQPLHVQDTQLDPRIDIKHMDPRIRSIGCWPVKINGTISCVLSLLSDHIKEFTSEETKILNTVADASGRWLSYLRLREEVGQNRRKLVALEEISRILNSSLELKTVLNMIIDLSVNLFEVDFSCVYLLDKEKKQFELKVARGVDEAILKNLECRFEEDRNFPNLTDFPVEVEEELLGYLTLGGSSSSYLEKDRDLVTTFANLAGVAIRNSLLYARRQKAYQQVVNALSLAIEARDKYMHGHTVTVREFALALGRKLGLDALSLQDLETASILHDIGKLGVSEVVLNKYGEFSDSEYTEFKKHSVVGAQIIEAVEDFCHLAPAIMHHHEKYDGTGYPDGLVGREIPLMARIIAVADAFAALTAVRHNSMCRTSFDALKLIKKDAGLHFDPELVEVFEKVLREKHLVRIDRTDTGETEAEETGYKIVEETVLTERELEILGLIAAGLNNKEISDTLYLSEKTVKTHVSNILRKLNLTDRTKAAVYAIKNGLVSWVEL